MKATARFFLLLGFWFTLSSAVQASNYLNGPLQTEPQKNFDILHYKLDLRLFPAQKALTGTVTIRITPTVDTLTSLKFDAAKMEILDVRTGNKRSVTWKKRPQKLLIRLQQAASRKDTMSIIIRYKLKEPEKGLYFNLPDSTGGNTGVEIYSQGEMEDNHYWFPCWDYPNDRATSEMIVTLPDTLIVVSNGKLIQVTQHPDGTRTFHWKMNRPHVSYLISLVAGNYARVVDHYKQIPVEYYVHARDTANARLTFGKTPEMIALFSRLLNFDYPYPKYAQSLVHRFLYGGMENISATTLNYSSLRDRRSLIDGTAEGLISHELAHQWFGDLVTCRTWGNSWLNEGFATYFAMIWTEHSRGFSQMQRALAGAAETYFTEDTYMHRRALVWNRYDTPEAMFDRHAYQKGALVLHMLRYELGDSLFWKGLQHYLKKNAWRCVVSADLKQAMEEASGKDLTAFFRDWVYGAGYPELKIEKFYDPKARKLHLTVYQTQEKDSLCGTFHFPVDIEIATTQGTKTYRVRIERDTTELSFPSPEPPRMVLFDKGHWLLKKITFPKSAAEWVYQLSHDDDALGRLDAVKALQDSLALKKVRNALLAQFPLEKTDYVRRELVRVLAADTTGAIAPILTLALHDPNSSVRRTALQALVKNPHLVPAPFDTLLQIYRTDSSYSVQRTVLALAAEIDSARAVPLLKEALHTPSFRQTIQTGALSAIRKAKMKQFIPEILTLLKPPSPDILRYQAVFTLTQIGEDDPRVYRELISHLRDPFRLVRRHCASTLGRLHRKDSLPALKAAYAAEKDERTRKILKRAIDRIEKEEAATQKLEQTKQK